MSESPLLQYVLYSPFVRGKTDVERYEILHKLMMEIGNELVQPKWPVPPVPTPIPPKPKRGCRLCGGTGFVSDCAYIGGPPKCPACNGG